MSQKPDEQQTFDPFGAWKNMRDSGMDAWSKMMIQMVNTEAYAQASSAMMDTWLTNSHSPFKIEVMPCRPFPARVSLEPTRPRPQ